MRAPKHNVNVALPRTARAPSLDLVAAADAAWLPTGPASERRVRADHIASLIDAALAGVDINATIRAAIGA